ncbi:MAG: GNAT family N-acetyltransferase [Fibrobacter sp.]|nr:GNAT family N-acetyltransferase [Fibrobacter sp.]
MKLEYSVLPVARFPEAIELIPEEPEGFERNLIFWNWKNSIPSIDNHKTIVFGAFDGNLLAGVCSFQPNDFIINGKKYLLHLVTDVVMAPDYRGKGLFSGFFTWCLANLENSEGTYLVASKMAKDIYTRRFEYKNLGRLSCYFAFANIEHLKHAKRGYKRALLHILSIINGRKKYTEDKEFTSGSFVLPPNINNMQNEKENKIRRYITREYLDWRYCSHPWRKYTFVGDKQGKYEHGFAILDGARIVELITTNETAAKEIIQNCINEIGKNKSPIAYCVQLEVPQERIAYLKAGFLKWPLKNKPFGLLQPPELFVKPRNGSLVGDILVKRKNWKFSNGDIGPEA